MHNAGGELPRILIPRTPVNRTPEAARTKYGCATQHIVPYRTEVFTESDYGNCLVAGRKCFSWPKRKKKDARQQSTPAVR
jgi:hypothetical protein